MLLETILAILVGIPLGVLTGLIPGLHVNTLIVIILSLAQMSPFSPIFTVALIVSILVTSMFVGFIPSILLGAPEADTALSVLPGHRLLLKGDGFKAIKLTVIGGVGSLIFSLFLLFLLSNFFTAVYEMSRSYIHFVLMAVVILMIVLERKPSKILPAALIFTLSGVLGLLVLETNVLPGQYALFPTFAGLFGISTVLMSLKNKNSIPKQNVDAKIEMSKSEIIKPIVIGTMAGLVVGLLPGVGVAQAAIMAGQFFALGGAQQFLITMSAVNSADSIFSLSALYLVGNPRSGAAVAVERVLGEVSYQQFLYLLGIMTFVGSVAALLTLIISRRIVNLMEKINYRKLSLLVIFFVTVMVIAFTGFMGTLVYLTATSIGTLAILLGSKRSHCMGVLLLPSILFFSGLMPIAVQVAGV